MAVVIKLLIVAPLAKPHVAVVVESLWSLSLLVVHQQLQFDGNFGVRDRKKPWPVANGSLVAPVVVAKVRTSSASSIDVERVAVRLQLGFHIAPLLLLLERVQALSVRGRGQAQ